LLSNEVSLDDIYRKYVYSFGFIGEGVILNHYEPNMIRELVLNIRLRYI